MSFPSFRYFPLPFLRQRYFPLSQSYFPPNRSESPYFFRARLRRAPKYSLYWHFHGISLSFSDPFGPSYDSFRTSMTHFGHPMTRFGHPCKRILRAEGAHEKNSVFRGEICFFTGKIARRRRARKKIAFLEVKYAFL